MSLPSTPPDEPTWIEIAQTSGTFEAGVIVGLLKTANIPTYSESIRGLGSIMGYMGDSQRIFIPERFYEAACVLLDDYYGEDDELALDEPSIKFKDDFDDDEDA